MARIKEPSKWTRNVRPSFIKNNSNKCLHKHNVEFDKRVISAYLGNIRNSILSIILKKVFWQNIAALVFFFNLENRVIFEKLVINRNFLYRIGIKKNRIIGHFIQPFVFS